jgi:hypothetical protein
MSRRAKISRIEELIASKRKAQQERRKQWAKALPIHAQRHATAVAAIVLAGEPKIDEPLIRAWARSLRHYEIAIDPTTKSEQIRAALHARSQDRVLAQGQQATVLQLPAAAVGAKATQRAAYV